MEVTPQYVYQPHQPHQPGSHRRSSPPSRFSAPMRTARTHARTTCSRLRCGAGCRGDSGRTDRVSCHTDARGGHSGLQSWSESHDRGRTAHIYRRQRLSRSNPAAASSVHASYMHSTTSMKLAGCAVRTDRPAEAAPARVASEPIRTRIYRPNAQGLMDVLAHTTGSYPYATGASLRPDGRVSFASCASIQCDCRSCEVDAKDRSDLHSRTEANAL